MTQRAILQYPDDSLHQVSAVVTAFDGGLRAVVDDLFDTLARGSAIGLAAPQIGVLQQIIVVSVPDDAFGARAYINPEIIEARGYGIVEESCLSVPDVVGNVVRHPEIRLRAQTLEGETTELELDGMHAVCVQHEIDHLNGKLFIDRLSWFKRLSIRRAAAKRLRAAAA